MLLDSTSSQTAPTEASVQNVLCQRSARGLVILEVLP